MVAEGESNQFPYYYGEIEGFKYKWGHTYSLRVVKEDVSDHTPSVTYRLVRILSDQSVSPHSSFDFQLKAPTHPPYFSRDEKGNVYLFGEVKMTFASTELKTKLLQLEGSAKSINGTFKHDLNNNEDVINLVSLRYD
ncbi:MAG: DUF4377 domain-containing protein [Blastocatellia bacterium]|nr:DUF4377 domain-containing protein [Blastocatellia bacterium]